MFRLATPLILFLFGLLIAVYSYRAYGDFAEYGAAFYPTVIGSLVAFFGLVDFVMEVKIKGKYVFQNFDWVQDGKIMLLMIGVVVFYIGASDYLGFVITTSLILIVMTLPLIKKHKMLTALFLFILSIGIYFLFAGVLLVGLPRGVLFE